MDYIEDAYAWLLGLEITKFLIAFGVCLQLYWILYACIENILFLTAPELYVRLCGDDRAARPVRMTMAVIHIIFGVFVTLPSCAVAAATTPYGYNQPFSIASGMCIVSKTSVWAAEFFLLQETSTGSFIQHICRLGVFNVLLLPGASQAKPVFVYLASQMGDLGPNLTLILTKLGHRPRNSWLLYGTILVSTVMIGIVTLGSALVSCWRVFESPYRIADYIWALGLVLVAFNCLCCVFGNLKMLGIVKLRSFQPFRFVLCDTVDMPLSHLFLAASFSVSCLFAMAIYCLFIDTPIGSRDIVLLALCGLIAVSLGLTSAIVLRLIYPVHAATTDPWGRELYLQYGAVIAGQWVLWSTTYFDGLSQATTLSSLALAMPLCFAGVRVAHYCSAQDKVTSFENTKLLGKIRIQKAEIAARGHLRRALSDLIIFVLSVSCLVSNLLSLSQAATLAVASSVGVQGLRLPRMHYDALWDSNPATFLQSLLTGVVIGLQLLLVVYHIVGNELEQPLIPKLVPSYLLLWSVMGLALVSAEYLTPSNGPCTTTGSSSALPIPNQPDSDHLAEGSRIRRYVNPFTLLLATCAVLEALLIRESVRGTTEKEAFAPPLGFENSRFLLSCPTTWAGACFMGILPIAVLGVLNM